MRRCRRHFFFFVKPLSLAFCLITYFIIVINIIVGWGNIFPDEKEGGQPGEDNCHRIFWRIFCLSNLVVYPIPSHFLFFFVLGWKDFFPNDGTKSTAGKDKKQNGDSNESGAKSSEQDQDESDESHRKSRDNKSGGGGGDDGGDGQLPPFMKDPWVAALLAAGFGVAALSLYKQLNQQDYEDLVSWKELKTQYLVTGKVWIEKQCAIFLPY